MIPEHFDIGFLQKHLPKITFGHFSMSLKILSILQGANSHILPTSHIWDSKAYTSPFYYRPAKIYGRDFFFHFSKFSHHFSGRNNGDDGILMGSELGPLNSPEFPSIIFLRFFLRFFSFSLPFFSFSLKYNGGVFGSELELQGELPFSCCLFKQKLSGLFHDHYENKKTTSHRSVERCKVVIFNSSWIFSRCQFLPFSGV